MILQQNYIKIVEYTQKAFKIYCRRALGNAIIKTLQHSNTRQKQKQITEEDGDGIVGHHRRMLSEDSGGYAGSGVGGVRELSLEQDSAKSQDKKTQVNVDKHGVVGKGQGVKNKLQIFYGDMVYIEFGATQAQSRRAKYFLNKLKFCKTEQVGLELSSDLRCIFEIVYPSQSLQSQKKGTLVTESSLISLRTISKNQYLRVKNSKIVYSDQFGKELQLSSHLNQCCVFELKYGKNSVTQQAIISGEELCFKLFDEMLYMNVLEEEGEAFFSQTPAFFTVEKIGKKVENLVPMYYRLKSNKFQVSILGNNIDLDSISQKKTMMNAIAVSQKTDKNIESKINPLNFIQYDFTKIMDQDPKLVDNVDPTASMLNCWQFIEVPGRIESNLYYLYNPIIGLGLALKSGKGLVKLTVNRKDFAVLRLCRHDEDIVSFTFEANLQQLDIIYDGLNSDKYLMVLSKPENQNQSKKIKIKHINLKTAYMICQMAQILDVLKAVYQFLNTWGNQLNQKLQTMYYSVKEIKLGSSTMLKKVRQMKIVIKIIKNYLQNNQNYTQQIQNTINSMKILEMIINICKVITNKIGNIYPYLQKQPQSPFCFAKNNLQEILISLFSLLLRLTKDNIANSNVVISEVDFFNHILIYYPEQIGQILQESIKNLSIFTTKNNSQNGGSQLFLWVKLIEPVREDTIRIQKTYIDIIAEVVVDPTDRGIPVYQNRCKELLFIQNSKRKCIPKFGIDPKQGKPIIIFENQSMMSDFLAKNRHLSKLNLVHLNSASYFIEDFYGDRYTPQADISEQYVGYIGSIINMFRNLCRNRNKKLFKVVDDWGINEQHIQLIFNCKKISWQLKATYLSLWSAIFIDEDPFLPFQKRQTKCHYWPKIQNYNLQDCTALIFKQYTDQTLAISRLNQLTLKIYPILSSYFFYLKKKLPSAYTDLPELRTFLTVLNTVHQIINLGYMTLKSMKDCIGVILGLLTGLDDVILSKKGSEQELQKYYHSILEKFVEILGLYEDIWVEIYGIWFLTSFYKESSSKNYCFKLENMEELWEDIIINTFQETDQHNYNKSYQQRKRTRHNVFSQNQHSLTSGISPGIEYFVLQNPLTFPQVDNEINNFIVKILVHRVLEVKCSNYDKIVKLLDNKKNRKDRICTYLQQIMILNSQQQQQIYISFSGRQSNKLLNWLKIQQIVHKITQIQTSNNNDQLEQRIKKQKILQLNNIVVKILREMRTYKQENTNMFRKCQFVLEKLGVHLVVMELLRYGEKAVYKDFVGSVLEFILEFMEGNQPNCRTLIGHLDKFVKNIGFEAATRIIPKIVKISNSSELVYKITQQLIYKININDSNPNLIMVLDRLLALSSSPMANHQQIVNSLARRVIQVYDLSLIRIAPEDRQTPTYTSNNGSDKIISSFEFIRLLCRLAGGNGELAKKMRACFGKSVVLDNLKRCNSYVEKKIQLKILVEIYIRGKELENFQIEDYLQMVILPQLKKLPTVATKLLHKNSKTLQKCPQIQSLYTELLPYEGTKIQTKDEQNYYDYILDQQQSQQVSILQFAGLVLGKWRAGEISSRLEEYRWYTRKLEGFLGLVFYEASSVYHHMIFQQLEAINLYMQAMELNGTGANDEKKQQTFSEAHKEEIKEFYHTLGQIIVEEKISINHIFTCFNINAEKLEMKRLNFIIMEYVTEEEFVECVRKLGHYVVKSQQLRKLINGVHIFRFANLVKDPKNKKIDLYSFMQKLIRLLEYIKNKEIKHQVQLITNPQLQLQQQQEQEHIIPQNIMHHLHIPHENLQIYQEQFGMQVRNFCKIAKKYENIIEKNLENKITMYVQPLNKKKLGEWVTHPSFNIFVLCYNYCSDLLIGLVLAVLKRYGEQEFNVKSVGEFLKAMELRFNQKIDETTMVILHELVIKLSPNRPTLQKLLKQSQKLYTKLVSQLLGTKNSQTVPVLQAYKAVFTQIQNNAYIDQKYKNKSKSLLSGSLKRYIGRGVDLYCGYDYEVMELLLGMWCDNQCYELEEGEVETGARGEGPGDQVICRELVRWIEQLVNKKSIKQLTSCNSKNTTYCKFALLFAKTLTKLDQPTTSPTIISHLLPVVPQIQQVANILFREYITPKNQSHIKQQYCLGRAECSEYFCNYDRLASFDENVLNLILNCFVLVRLACQGAATRDVTAGKKDIEGQGQAKQVTQEFQTMLGSIKYRLYGRESNYIFKLPSCRLFYNSDIERSMLNMIQQLPPQKIHLYLHPLSKIFSRKLSTISFIQHRISILRHIFYYKRPIKLLILLLLVLLTFLDANSTIIPSYVDYNPYFEHPIIRITCMVMLMIQGMYLAQEMWIFVGKCLWYYPVVVVDEGDGKLGKSRMAKSDPHKTQSQFLITLENKNTNKQIGDTANIETQQNYKTVSQIPVNPASINEKSKAQTKNQKNPQTKPIRLSKVVYQFVTNHIMLRFLLVLAYIATIVNSSFFVFCLLLSALDIESTRIFLRGVGKILHKISFIYIFNCIFTLYSLIFYCQRNPQLSSSEVTSKFFSLWYQAILIGDLNFDDHPQIVTNFMLQQVITFFSLMIILFYISAYLFLIEKEKKQFKDKCWVCLKNREQIEKGGASFQGHLMVEHRLWDYLYFFIEWDRMAKMDSIDSQIQDQIKKGQYKFIKLF